MYEDTTHPFLAQVPLTVSPFVSLPTTTTLPHTYKPLPSTLPPSSTTVAGSVDAELSSNKDSHPKFIQSASGRAAHPDDIILSCKTLQRHLKTQQTSAEQSLQSWEEKIVERELAEKRRVAPGWLDRDEKILQPERIGSGQPEQFSNPSIKPSSDSPQKPTEDAGNEIDRAFGSLSVHQKS